MNPGSSKIVLSGRDHRGRCSPVNSATCTLTCRFVVPCMQTARITRQSQHIHIASHAGCSVGVRVLSCCTLDIWQAVR